MLTNAEPHAPADRAAEQAFDMAWAYLAAAGVPAQPASLERLAADIMSLLDRGERHPLRLANLAIVRFQNA